MQLIQRIIHKLWSKKYLDRLGVLIIKIQLKFKVFKFNKNDKRFNSKIMILLTLYFQRIDEWFFRI